MFVNEATYRHTASTLSGVIALTDARIEAARTLQTLTELEAAAGALRANNIPAERHRFETAARELTRVQDKALAAVAQVDSENVGKVRTLIDQQSQRLHDWVNSAPGADDNAGRTNNITESRSKSADLAREFDDVLNKGTIAQQDARASLYATLLLRRIAIHTLLLLSLLAYYLFIRQLRRSDEERSQENQCLERQIGERTAELRDLAGHLVTAREDERARLARELHDELGGLLTAMKLELARLRRMQELPQGALERVTGIERRLNDGIALKRRIIEHLRPSSLDQLGLKAALEMLCADTSAISGLPVLTQLEDVPLGNKDAELTLYRMVQESLTNIAKYAQASEVQVRLQRNADDDNMVTLTVQDDGRGFDPNKVATGRHGLFGMRVRLEAHEGALRVESTPGNGTQIVATMPCAVARTQVETTRLDCGASSPGVLHVASVRADTQAGSHET